MSTGLATLASGGSSRARRVRASPRRAPGARGPPPRRRRRRGCPRPPALVSTPTRRPLGCGWRREQRRDVEQLLERRGADDAGLVEERVDRGLGAGQRGRVRARGPPARRGRAALQREDRLAPGDAAGEPRETCAGCRTTRGRGARRRVAGSSSHHSSRSFDETSALFPIETKAERPSPRDSAASSRARPSAPLCDEKPMCPRGAERGANVALRLRAGDGDARGSSGPISRAPCARTSASSALLPLRAPRCRSRRSRPR